MISPNTNRRSFLKQISLGLSAAIFTPHIVAATWKDTLKYGKLKGINPAWVNAPYEVCFVGYGDFEDRMSGDWKFIPTLPYPKRFELVDGKYLEILP